VPKVMPFTRKSVEVAHRALPIVPDWGEHRSRQHVEPGRDVFIHRGTIGEDWFVLLMVSFHCGDNTDVIWGLLGRSPRDGNKDQYMLALPSSVVDGGDE
jgi:hypothetical protein